MSPRPTALGRAIDRLEAERLTPVPRASRVFAIDAGDLAAIIAHVEQNTILGRMSPEAAAAYGRLHQLARMQS